VKTRTIDPIEIVAIYAFLPSAFIDRIISGDLVRHAGVTSPWDRDPVMLDLVG
jgi:hypothetical protein